MFLSYFSSAIGLESCPEPQTPNYGIRQGDRFMVGDVVQFSCEQGYSLQVQIQPVCLSECHFINTEHYILKLFNAKQKPDVYVRSLKTVQLFLLSPGCTNQELFKLGIRRKPRLRNIQLCCGLHNSWIMYVWCGRPNLLYTAQMEVCHPHA